MFTMRESFFDICEPIQNRPMHLHWTFPPPLVALWRRNHDVVYFQGGLSVLMSQQHLRSSPPCSSSSPTPPGQKVVLFLNNLCCPATFGQCVLIKPNWHRFKCQKGFIISASRQLHSHDPKLAHTDLLNQTLCIVLRFTHKITNFTEPC